LILSDERTLAQATNSMWYKDGPVIVRAQTAEDYDAIRHVYAEAFRRPRFRQLHNPGSVPPEVGLFEALWEAGDAIPEFSFTALTDSGVVGHVTASRAIVGTDPVVAVGPIGVLPGYQGTGIGSALMEALLAAADAAAVPLIALLGAPDYYRRFGFRPAKELGVTPPEPEWGDGFQVRPLNAYKESVVGRFQYALAFSSSSHR
jgi:putative acetyltransferase